MLHHTYEDIYKDLPCCYHRLNQSIGHSHKNPHKKCVSRFSVGTVCSSCPPHFPSTQQKNTFSINLLSDFSPTNLYISLLWALSCCSIVTEQSRILVVYLPELSLGVRMCLCVCACVRACVGGVGGGSDYVPIYICYCFSRMWRCGLCNSFFSPFRHKLQNNSNVTLEWELIEIEVSLDSFLLYVFSFVYSFVRILCTIFIPYF